MLEFIFTSKGRMKPAALFLLLLLCAPLCASLSHANDGFGTSSTPSKGEEDDYSTTPYTDYGEFNEDEEEAETTQYLQYGRFFGVSLGIGTHGATGNRGQLWTGGFPLLDLKIHYWYNFNFALQFGYTTAPHSFSQTNNTTQVTMARAGLDLKYYFDTRDLSSAITFAGPYLFIGAGDFIKTQTSTISQTPDNDSAVGLSFGAGMEFTVSPKRVYFYLQGQVDMVTFKDTSTGDFIGQGLGDLSGNFYSFIGGFLFTW